MSSMLSQERGTVQATIQSDDSPEAENAASRLHHNALVMAIITELV